jgi:hypothetical protein
MKRLLVSFKVSKSYPMEYHCERYKLTDQWLRMWGVTDQESKEGEDPLVHLAIPSTEILLIAEKESV